MQKSLKPAAASSPPSIDAKYYIHSLRLSSQLHGKGSACGRPIGCFHVCRPPLSSWGSNHARPIVGVTAEGARAGAPGAALPGQAEGARDVVLGSCTCGIRAVNACQNASTVSNRSALLSASARPSAWATAAGTAGASRSAGLSGSPAGLQLLVARVMASGGIVPVNKV